MCPGVPRTRSASRSGAPRTSTGSSLRRSRTDDGRRAGFGMAAADIESTANEGTLGDLGPGENPADRAVIEHQHPVAAADQFVIVGGVIQDRSTAIGQLAQQLVDLGL